MHKNSRSGDYLFRMISLIIDIIEYHFFVFDYAKRKRGKKNVIYSTLFYNNIIMYYVHMLN